jgi:hypothetical protein
MPAIRLQRDLNTHRMTDDHGALDERIVEYASNVICEVLDGHPRGVTRQRRPSMSTVMRMDTVAVG